MPESLPSEVSNRIRECQQALIERAKSIFGEDSITERIEQAFMAVPRHRFVPKYLHGESGLWSDIDSQLLDTHLDSLYADQPLCILQNAQGIAVSTISQPSLVLEMLHLLDLKPNQKIFELGGGSGWNAALIGKLVEPHGQVFSTEIEDTLVENARKAIEDLAINNVTILAGDASRGLPEEAPFDRCVFTASAKELPIAFFDQVKDDGILLFVFKFLEREDILTVLRKKGDYFQSELHFPCRFVPLHGSKIERLDTRIGNSAKWSEFLSHDLEELSLSFYRRGEAPSPEDNRWVFDRGDCSCVWEVA